MALQERVLVLLRAAVRGFDRAEAPQIFRQAAPRDLLPLVCEPANPYDARAERIDRYGHKLGCVPRGNNADIAHRLDADEALATTISDMAEGVTARHPVALEIVFP